VFVALFVLHGANFLVLKAPEEIAKRTRKVAFTGWIAATVLIVAFVIWTFFATDILTKPGLNGLIPAVLAAVALLVTGWLVRIGKDGWAFVTGALTIVFVTVMVFAGLYPRILISSLSPDWSLTITNAASSHYTLTVMTIVAAIFVPIVLAYQGWTYWVFRKRVETRTEKLVY
jgi:cytochrome d ubiquinol oxidase subunit II